MAAKEPTRQPDSQGAGDKWRKTVQTANRVIGTAATAAAVVNKARSGHMLGALEEATKKHQPIEIPEDLKSAENMALSSALGTDPNETPDTKTIAKKFAVKAVKKWTIRILAPFVVALIVFALLFLLVGRFKAVHFGTVMRAYHYAHAHLIMKRQLARAVAYNAILSADTGTARPLIVDAMLKTTTSGQLKQLGNEGRMVWHLPNGKDLTGAIVIIDDVIYRMSDYTGGRDYSSLSAAEKRQAQARFFLDIQTAANDVLKYTSRLARMNPAKRMAALVRFALIRVWLKGQDLSGKSPKEVATAMVDDHKETIITPEERLPKPGIDKVADKTEEALIEAMEARKEGREPDRVRSSINIPGLKGAGKASDVVFVITMACIVHMLNQMVEEAQPEREAQMVRLATSDLVTTAQIKEGDVISETVDTANAVYDGVGPIADASNAILYQEITGKEIKTDGLTAEQLIQLAKIPRTSFVTGFGEFIGWIDGVVTPAMTILNFTTPASYPLIIASDWDIDKVINEECNVLLNEWVQYGLTAVDLIISLASLGTYKSATTVVLRGLLIGVEFVGGIVLTELLEAAIQKSLWDTSGASFAGLAVGEDGVNERIVAGEFAAQNANRNIAYGSPKTAEEATQIQAIAMQDLKSEYQNKSFATRYFAIDNPFSLAGQFAAHMPSSFVGLNSNLQEGVRSLGSILNWPVHVFGSLGSVLLANQPAYAAGTSLLKKEFGIVPWIWSLAELERIDSDPSFELEPLAAIVEPRLDELNARYNKCYDDSTFILQHQTPEECTADFLSAGNRDFGDDALYWRYYQSLLFTATALTGDLAAAK